LDTVKEITSHSQIPILKYFTDYFDSVTKYNIQYYIIVVYQ